MKKNGSKGARNGGETSKYNFLQGVRSQRYFRQASRFGSGQDPDKHKFVTGTRQKLSCPNALYNFGSGQDPYKHKFVIGTR